MKISLLQISNFKAIRNLELRDLGDVVVVAGPNGCGKSCILDAIRFLKASYAGYRQQDEWRHFFSEFQLDINNSEEIRRLFYDPNEPIRISAEFALADSEVEYIRKNAKRKIRELLAQQTRARRTDLFGPASKEKIQLEEASRDIDLLSDSYSKQVIVAAEAPTHRASVALDSTPLMTVEPNIIFDFVFGVYDPANIGIIDYHSAHRTYQREKVGGINVNIQEATERVAQHALFNWQNKYTHIKSELAGAFIRDLFIEKAGGSAVRTPSIVTTMKELFQLFLPGKNFNGPRPGLKGELSFPVKISGGAEHDIDDLSSGEKELVHGYLRIRNVAPQNSIILLDEPELHLNPRLVVGLPGFYRKHLGVELGNQLWMTTHSDTFLRDAYKTGGFTIFHMSAPDTVEVGENQGVPILADDEINQAIIDLVGDIAGFRPGNKVVIFESTESASFDAALTKRLFPEFGDRITALSGDNKFGVRQLYAALSKAVAQMALPFEVYAITDRDSDPAERPRAAQVYSWDVYHIENYLLDGKFIAKVMRDNPSYAFPMAEGDVESGLRECARQTLRPLVAHRMRVRIHSAFSECLDLGFDPAIDVAQGLAEAVTRVRDRIQAKSAGELGGDKLKAMEVEIMGGLERSLQDGSWRSEFRGRDILKLFARHHLAGLPYEAFRDAIIARMADDNYRPAGMADTLGLIMQR